MVDNVNTAGTISSKDLKHLPLLVEALERLGIRQTILTELPDDIRSCASYAECVIVMILNILFGRVALYKMNDWLVGFDVAVMLGEGVDPAWFTDAKLAATLDRIYKYGTDDLLSAVVTKYLRSEESPKEYTVPTDTTSIKLYGAYEGEYGPDEPSPERGHSKDHRPDLKQLIYGLSLQGATGVPLCVSMLDGSTSDHIANRLHIDRLAGLLPPEHEATLVFDCKGCDAKTIGLVLDAAFHFITLVPRTFNLRQELVQTVVDEGVVLKELVREDGRTRAHSPRVYEGVSVVRPFKIIDPESGPKMFDLRFLVVRSSKLAEHFEASLEDKLRTDLRSYQKAVRELAGKTFFCEADARESLREFQKKVAGKYLHAAVFQLVEEVITLRRGRKGRPCKGESPPSEKRWRIASEVVVVNDKAVAHARTHASFFVLASDHAVSESWSDKKILEEYRHQSLIEGHTGFRWLKGVAEVAPVFLKTPRRIAALGVVFMLALMVRNYIQYRIRQALAEREETLPNMNRQPTAKPTTENVFNYFTNVRTSLICGGDMVTHRLVQGLEGPALRVLQLLEMDPSIFVTPRAPDRKSKTRRWRPQE